ncbi:adaptor complexes medium subunit family protein [Cardiosporidium cionae]|uniref:Coatomer subunit delta n=1 Tax=Cardiosporidium cionae TaxID=476202 RepID=A0ABQ7J9M0_9APIC|nr:adaptor complexes medium subunit family protein [Cardiosporidium cionae]|eukprot:KAF8820689.1 adaptor complexes medium subunit family protein [Cardiosporidium cionae]
MSPTATLLARQFVEITRLRVQGLLSAFLKLIENRSSDHTYIETENVRYVYQHIESVLILLITNKQSNILEDLETTRLLSQVAQDVCQETLSDEVILKNSFDLVFAFDEVISFGYRESVTLSQIQSYTIMESHDEKLHSLIRQSKEKEEKERRDVFAKKFESERNRRRKGSGPFHDDPFHVTDDYAQPLVSEQRLEWSLMYENWLKDNFDKPSSASSNAFPASGMRLTTMKGVPTPLSSLSKETAVSKNLPVTVVEESEKSEIREPLTLSLQEKIVGQLQLEGGLESISMEGCLHLVIHDAQTADLASFLINERDSRFKFMVHPSLDKTKYAQNILELKNPNQPFQKNNPSALLKWRLLKSSEELLPLSISCWPSANDEGTSVSIELELAHHDYPLEDIHIQIMCPVGSDLQISTVSMGYTEEDDVTLHWKIPRMDATTTSGVLEFFVKIDSSSLFPLTLEAFSDSPLCNLEVLRCSHMKTKENIDMKLKKHTTFSFAVGS